MRTLLCILIALPALATTGGPVELRVLGADPEDGHKAFVLRGSEAGELPTLLSFNPARPWRGLFAPASWRRDDDDWSAHETRIAKLKGRLTRLKRVPPAEVKVRASKAGAELCLHGEIDLNGDRCRVTDVQIEWAGLRGQLRARGWDKGKLRGVWAGEGYAIAIWRHMGRTYEGGYFEDLATVLHAAPRPKVQPWKPGCAKTECALRIGRRLALKTYAQDLLCAERAPWLACVWSVGRFQQAAYFDLRTGARDAIPVPARMTGAKVRGPLRWKGSGLELTLKSVAGKVWRVTRVGPPPD